MAQARFLEGSLLRHIAVMSFTASVGLMAIFLVDFADMYFISLLGETALAAAIGYAGTVIFFTVSVAIGLSIATGALVARSLGQRKPSRARIYATNVITVGVGVGIATSFVVWLYAGHILAFLGAKGDALSEGVTYLRIVVPSLPIAIAGFCGVAILRAHGDARRAMWVTIIGGLVNAALDPLLIFVLDWKLSGAAWATVAARIAVFFAAFRPVYAHYGGLAPLRLPRFIKDLSPVSAIAVPAILTNVATPIGNTYVVRALAEFGDDAVAGIAIVGRIVPVSFSVVFALSGAIGPIIGQNFGARQFDRVRQALFEGLRFTFVYVLLVSLILMALSGLIADAFKAEGDTRTLIFLFCNFIALTYFFNGAIFVANASFNNLGRPFYSTALNWGKNTLGTIPFVIWGAATWGAPGVLIGQAVGGVIFAFLAVWLGFRLIQAYADGRIDPSNARRPRFTRPTPANPQSPIRG